MEAAALAREHRILDLALACGPEVLWLGNSQRQRARLKGISRRQIQLEVLPG